METKYLLGSLEYSEKLLSLGQRTVFDVRSESIACFSEEEFSGEEIVLNQNEGENWVCIKRLQETRAPRPSPGLIEWIEGEIDNPAHEPALKPKRMCRLSADAIDRLKAQSAIRNEDVLAPIRKTEENLFDVLLFVDRLPEVKTMWDDYLAKSWRPWSEIEKPRRQVISLYNKLYQIHQRIVSFGEDNPIELVFGLGVACWAIESRRILSPIIEQSVETELQDSGALIIRPRSVDPIINLKPFHELDVVQASEAVQREATERLRAVLDAPDIVFSPFEKRSFEGVLRLCMARLSPTGRYHPDEDSTARSLPPLKETLCVTDNWVVFARQRTEDIRRDDLKRLIEKVSKLSSDDDLPGCTRSFVRPPRNVVTGSKGLDLDDDELPLPETPKGFGPKPHSGTQSSTIEPNSEGRRRHVFFPLPYNEEQIEIIQTLDRKEVDGVVVQGPPGTGKTHTIANIVCHYLARGKTILVTAKTAEALVAVQEKLPKEIRRLAMSVVYDDRDGARQLEAAMTLLSNEAKQIKTDETSEGIRSKDQRLVAIQKRKSEIEAELSKIARHNLSDYLYKGDALKPMDLAERIGNERAIFEWFPDRFADETIQPQFSDSDVEVILQARTKAGSALAYPTKAIPTPENIPTLSELICAHTTLRDVAGLNTLFEDGAIPVMIVTRSSDFESARFLAEFIDYIEGLNADVPAKGEWYRAIVAKTAKLTDSGDGRMLSLLERWADLAERGALYVQHAVDIGNASHDISELDEAFDRLSSGKAAFKWPIGNKALKDLLATVRIGESPPRTAGEWTMAAKSRKWNAELAAYIPDWNRLTVSLGLLKLEAPFKALRAFIVHHGDRIFRAAEYVRAMPEARDIARRLFPCGIDVNAVFYNWDIAGAKSAVTSNLARLDAQEAESLRVRILSLTERKSHLPFYAKLALIAERLGSTNVSHQKLGQEWQEILAHANSLSDLRPLLAIADEKVLAIRQSGAPQWADQLRHDSSEILTSKLKSGEWHHAWEWARADAFVGKIINRERLNTLREEQKQIEAEERRLFAEIVRLRTFLGLKQKMTDTVESALNKFSAAISKLGSGTGKAAPRYRRIIRHSTAEASGAIPCWIMPEWRVSEQLPPTLGMFDLVIVDEASQSDITALPAILRGKKLLIVGDDKQVSPSTVGIEERQIIQLRTTYLTGHPYADQMDPGSSLYDLAKIVFPGRCIMLKEHFRCVEPIIRFSNQFYTQPLIPLRVPTSNERLDPPLVDIFVKGGTRARDVNEAEAKVIVDRIREMTSDRQFERRSIGVISLIGDKQAKRIHDLLLKELGPDTIARHRIMCGNAATFQGQERDIVLLSMVECPQTSTSKTSRVFEQRFNVALSRARDRLILVRSVDLAGLKEGDLKRKVIQHFKDPMGGPPIAMSPEVLELCESDFERDVGRALIDHGYRIRVQVKVGAYRIDLVVEGRGDKRLAVECDGDRYHTIDKWAEDMNRQKMLERMGWIFWRVWGSHWRTDKAGCITDLQNTLHRLGIEPLGATPPSYEWTKHEIVDLAACGEAEAPRPSSNPEPSVPSRSLDLSTAAPERTLRDSELANLRTPPSAIIVPSRGKRSTFESELVKFPKEEIQSSGGDNRVRIGSSVVVRFAATNRIRKLTISEHANNPKDGIVWAKSPLGEALMNASVDEEVEYEVNKERFVAVVQSISHSPTKLYKVPKLAPGAA